MRSLKNIISEHPFFKDLDEQHLDLITGCATNVRFEPGDFIYREGQVENSFYIIRQGQVSIEIFVPSKGAVQIQSILEGDVLGWSWLFEPYEAHFDARALELTRAIAFDGICLRKKCKEDPIFGYHLLKRITGIIRNRLKSTRLQLLDLYNS